MGKANIFLGIIMNFIAMETCLRMKINGYVTNKTKDHDFEFVFHTRDGETIKQNVSEMETDMDITLGNGTSIRYEYEFSIVVVKIQDRGNLSTCYAANYGLFPLKVDILKVDYYFDRSISISERYYLSREIRRMCADIGMYLMSTDPTGWI